MLLSVMANKSIIPFKSMLIDGPLVARIPEISPVDQVSNLFLGYAVQLQSVVHILSYKFQLGLGGGQ